MSGMSDPYHYKGKVVYRQVAFWPDDLRALERIAARLKKLYGHGTITGTGDIDDLGRINRRLEKLIKKYSDNFEAHSSDFNFKVSEKDWKSMLDKLKTKKPSTTKETID
jgi:hypothetical protein